jgi:hypothetical protein
LTTKIEKNLQLKQIDIFDQKLQFNYPHVEYPSVISLYRKDTDTDPELGPDPDPQ